MRRVFWTSGLAALLLPGAASGQTARQDSVGFIVVTTDDVKFAATGISQQIISGDPSKPGLYVIRIRFAPGQTSKPHFHDQDRYVTVIKGTWWIALGPGASVFDTSKMVPMKAGSVVKHPAGGVHYDGAKDEEAIVQITGMGPVKTIDVQRGARLGAPTAVPGVAPSRGRSSSSSVEPPRAPEQAKPAKRLLDGGR